MGQPIILNRMISRDEFMVPGGHTRGSETSQYPQEEKSSEMALVVASESAGAQTEVLALRGCGTGTWHGDG